MLAAFSITPLGAGDSVGAPVADAVRLVRESGLPNETNAMFTNVEGEWDEVMGLLKRCVEAVAATAPRVSVVVKLDYRPGTEDALHGKVESIERHLADGERGLKS
ncbi:MAG: MTH1187 family thiamine-binding protein [Acidimicrobiia bacterium]